MIGLLFFVLAILASPFKSKLRLEAENAVLRHQLIVLRRTLLKRVRGTVGFDSLERITTQTLMDILEVPQRQRTAGTYRHLAKLMSELGGLDDRAGLRFDARRLQGAGSRVRPQREHVNS